MRHRGATFQTFGPALRRRCVAQACALFLALGVSIAPGASGQLSPGPLSEAHESLEGSAQCLQCHSGRRGVDPALCFQCHEALADRVNAGLGLHAEPEFASSCERCHIEHQGRSFELVWWGEEGMQAFDHQRVSYPLEGAHKRAGCRDCHRRSLVADVTALAQGGADPESTFLGLSTSCSSCHADFHDGQFANRSCDTCHTLEGFEGAKRFEHAATSFPLLGRHQEVDCLECHTSTTRTSEAGERSELVGAADLAATPEVVGFTGLEFADCSSCHLADPHEGRLGSRCATCHEPAGWRVGARTSFDHSRTRFQLSGAHRAASCESCHGSQLEHSRPAFAACTDCHLDVHFGRWASQANASEGDRCVGCHTESRFAPSSFDVAAHQSSAFPLTGQHTAASCEGCHLPTPLEQLASRMGSAESTATTQRDPFSADAPRAPSPRFVPMVDPDTSSCSLCHADPHAGTASGAGDSARPCSACHDTSAWWSVGFAHRETGFALDLGHRGLDCQACHGEAAKDGSRPEHEATELRFDRAPVACAGCHADPHDGQFSTLAPDGSLHAVACEQCHLTGRFVPAQFDHRTDARFPLEGAHRSVACGECHPTVETAQGPVVRYRPLPYECADCHGQAAVEPGQGGPR